MGQETTKKPWVKKDGTKPVESFDDKDEHHSQRITKRNLQKPTVNKSFIKFC